MPFDNGQNRSRVDNIVHYLGLIDKSARSNGAGADEMVDMLRPVSEALAALTGAPGRVTPGEAGTATSGPDVERTGPSRPGHTPAPWAEIVRVAREADLNDLTRAMAVYLDRLTCAQITEDGDSTS